MMTQLRKFGTLLVPPIVLLLFLMFTDPYKLPLALIVVPFVLVAFGLYRAIKAILGLSPLSSTKVRLISGITTGLVVLLLVFASLHQFSIKDFLILAALLAGLTFYLRRIDI